MPITSAKKVVPTTMQSLATPSRHREQHRNNTLPKSKSILSSTFTSTAQQQHQPSFFVSNSPNSTKPNNFRSRAKLPTTPLKSHVPMQQTLHNKNKKNVSNVQYKHYNNNPIGVWNVQSPSKTESNWLL